MNKVVKRIRRCRIAVSPPPQPLLLLLLFFVCVNGCGRFATVEPPPPKIGKDAPVPHAVRQLQVELEAILSHPILAASNVGVKVVSLANGEVLYQKDPEKLYHPASTMKLLTAATALVKLKPDFSVPHGALY